MFYCDNISHVDISKWHNFDDFHIPFLQGFDSLSLSVFRIDSFENLLTKLQSVSFLLITWLISSSDIFDFDTVTLHWWRYKLYKLRSVWPFLLCWLKTAWLKPACIRYMLKIATTRSTNLIHISNQRRKPPTCYNYIMKPQSVNSSTAKWRHKNTTSR